MNLYLLSFPPPFPISSTHMTICRYDPQKGKWESSKGMATLRSRVGVAVVDQKLYAFGGYDGSSRLYTVECFDPEVSLLFSAMCVGYSCYVKSLRESEICVYMCEMPFR